MQSDSAPDAHPRSPSLIFDLERTAATALGGYYYQVLRSVLAWLDLDDSEVLYLEAAEDFDRVSETEALAVQVKASAIPVTLRTPSVVSAIGNFWAHRTRNPDRRVNFQYLTTASIGREQNSPFEDGISGIQVWNELKDSPNPERQRRQLRQLRGFLCSLSNLSEEVAQYLGQATELDLLEEVIRRISWLTNADPAEAIVEAIKKKLVILGDRRGVLAADAERVFGALCLRAWETATRPQDRALDKADLIRLFDAETHALVPRSVLSALVAGTVAQRDQSTDRHHGPSSIDLSPRLPTNFVVRTTVTDRLKASLLDQIDRRSSLVSLALTGMGGVGKSVLASSLARDESIRSHYPDGVLWVTLGQKPEILSQLRGWLSVISAPSLIPTHVEMLSACIRAELATARFLLVIDDAWDVGHVTPFLVGGPKCATVITTRDSVVARMLGPQIELIDVLSEAEGMELFQRSLGAPLNEANLLHARKLIRVLERLPLAIEIAAAQVSDGVAIETLCSMIESEIARLEALDLDAGVGPLVDEVGRKHRSVEASFALSIRDKPLLASAFSWLGIVPDDATFTIKAAGVIWGQKDETETALRLAQLKRCALIQEARIDGEAVRRFRLHDLLHDFARRLLVASPEELQSRLGVSGLGISFEQANGTVVDRYLAFVDAGNWSGLPIDGYVDRYLAYHMEKAGRLDDLYELLHSSNRDGKNAWFLVRETAGDTGGFASDVMRLKRSAIEASKSNSRYFLHAVSATLIQSTLVSRARSTPASLASACIEHGLWTVDQGLAYARLKPAGDLDRIWLLAMIAARLEDELQIQVIGEAYVDATRHLARGGLVASLGIEERTLELLMPVLPEHLRSELVTLSALAPVRTQARMAVEMARHLDVKLQSRLLESVRDRCGPDSPGPEGDKVRALAELARIPTSERGRAWEEGILFRALEAKDFQLAYDTVKAIAPYVGGYGRIAIMSFVKGLDHPDFSAGVLLSFGSNLTAEFRDVGIRLIDSHQDPIIRDWVRGQLATVHPCDEEMLRAAIESISRHPKDHRKFAALRAIRGLADPAFHLDLEVAAIEAGKEFGFGELGAMPVREFIDELSAEGISRLTDVVAASGSHFDRAQVLPSLLARVVDDDVARLCNLLLKTLRESRFGPDFGPFANRIPIDLLPEFLEACAHIADEDQLADTMVSASWFTVHASEASSLQELLLDLFQRSSGSQRGHVGARISRGGVVSVSSEIVAESLDLVRRDILNSKHVDAAQKNSESLGSLIGLLAEDECDKVIVEILKNEISAISDYHREPYLLAFNQAASGKLTADLVHEFGKVPNARSRANLLAGRALKDRGAASELFGKALRIVSGDLDDYEKYIWIEQWIDRLPRSLMEESLKLADGVKKDDLPTRMILLTLPYRPRPVRRRVEAKLIKMRGETLRSLRRGAIRPYLLDVLSKKQWRDLALSYQESPDFIAFVVCMGDPDNDDLYERAFVSGPIKRPTEVDVETWLSFGLACSSTSGELLQTRLRNRLLALEGLDRRTLLPEITFLWPILDAIGGYELVGKIARAAARIQTWWS